MNQDLSEHQITLELEQLPGWSHVDHALAKDFTFLDFPSAIAFLVRAAFEAEAMNHHPDWRNVYNRVSVRLQTHDAGAIVTAKDVELARRIERCAEAAAPK